MDVIWGNVGRILSGQIFELSVTHRKDDNKKDYADVEKIKFTGSDVPTIPQDPNECTKESLEQNIAGMFVKCEVSEKSQDGCLISFVSHSGQGGY